jgi:hypothetical protein
MSDAENCGVMGAKIGHDVTHFVDGLGADYNVDGAMRHWWTVSYSTRFEIAADPLGLRKRIARSSVRLHCGSSSGTVTRRRCIVFLLFVTSMRGYDAFDVQPGQRLYVEP